MGRGGVIIGGRRALAGDFHRVISGGMPVGWSEKGHRKDGRTADDEQTKNSGEKRHTQEKDKEEAATIVEGVLQDEGNEDDGYDEEEDVGNDEGLVV